MTDHDAILTSVAAWGASEGISRQAAHTAVRRCGIPLQDGRVDPAVASALYRQRTRPRATTKPPPAAAAPEPGQAGEHVTYHEARRRQAVADAIHSERELQRQAGELVWLADVESEYVKLLVSVRESFMQLPARLVPLLAADPTPAGMDQVLREAIAEVLRALAQHPMLPAAHREGTP